MSRVFHIVGGIDEGTLKDFYRFFEKVKEAKQDAIIRISSSGGDPDVALAIAGIMRNSSSQVNWTTIASGYCNSAATLILAAGHTRKMTDTTFAMVHEGTEKVKGNASDLETYAAHMQRYERHWNKLLEKYTGTKEDVWAELSENETYLDAKQCLDLGLCTEIL